MFSLLKLLGFKHEVKKLDGNKDGYTLTPGYYNITISEERKKITEEINKNTLDTVMFNAAAKSSEGFEPEKEHFTDEYYDEVKNSFVEEFKEWMAKERINPLPDIAKKINEFIDTKKTEILLAWWAKYGFEPGRAVLVEQHTEKGMNIFIREEVDGELVMASGKPEYEVETFVGEVVLGLSNKNAEPANDSVLKHELGGKLFRQTEDGVVSNLDENDEEFRTDYCEGCILEFKLLGCQPHTRVCNERRKIICRD